MRIKKTLLWMTVLAVFAVAAVSGTLSASAGETQRVLDGAGLFTDAEREALEEQLQEGMKGSGMDLVVLTIDDAQGKSAGEYANDYYDSNKLGKGLKDSGALCLIDMDNREIYISTFSKMTRVLTDERIEAILDNAYAYASEGRYAACASSMIQDIASYAADGIVDGQYNYDEATGRVDVYRPRSVTWYEFLIALAAAGSVAVFPCISVMKQYRMEEEQKQALNYHLAYRGASAFAFTVASDMFLNKMVSQRRLPQNLGGPRSGGMGGAGGMGGSMPGRSTVHRSSSGRMHGGGGRKF